MSVAAALARVVAGTDLDQAQMAAAMRSIMSGEATPAQIGGLLVALRMKGETVVEIAAAAQVMREFAVPVEVAPERLVDTCGTGGDGAGLFNVSTAAGFVVAAAGGRVAKHGNRSVSSSSGSADVLEALGVRIALSPAAIARCIDEVGFGFMFAPAHHGASRHALGPRRDIAIRTLFNLLGPLTNPARPLGQVVGVYDAALVEPIAQVLARLGSRHVLVVHADDGLDEISLGAATEVAELRDGAVRSYRVEPEQFGFARVASERLAVADVTASVALLREALAGTPGPARDIVALNAGAALYVAGLADSLASGVQRAGEVLASGAALHRVGALAALSQRLEAA
ncbi:MAG: anthranilate phosphoribosyltransferase [Immundisolibacter sp.]|uniref:anthranilate phosphoribosyltransferase n=1 Tax=Immundisolibacter sp. TaxID=1934948 RepID=UPI001983263D|nr:anthranilate phosphoribosyltransferase [Immundisolibacter sp.]MBC7161627.1 anthranilate phosphoribosyltransferase [Immundisolibacter sp.]